MKNFTTKQEIRDLLNKDQNGVNWKNAIKFESKEQYERLIKGEI